MEVIEVSGLKIEFHRDRVKNINLRVYPPTGRIRVSAPWYMRMAVVEDFIRQREHWIKEKLSSKKAREAKNKSVYREGELIPFKGADYTLKLICKNTSVNDGFHDQTGELIFSGKGISSEKLQKKTEALYRAYLKAEIPKIVARYESAMGVKVREIGVKKMKTRWGSCNIRAGRIWLGLDLARKRPLALEYVVVHEMAHLLEKYHNKRFYSILNKYFPRWKEVEKELNGRKRFID